MILIADSGSSKTDWVSIDRDQSINHYKSKGINPFFQSADDIFLTIEKTFKNVILSETVDYLYFYGSGCIKNLNSHIVVNGLSKFFQKAIIEVEDDMIGTARSIFNGKSGIACILGTGANSCKYDGSQIVERIPTLGYILGDEASGAYFGKKLINHYFKKIMPKELAEKFQAQFSLELSDVLNKVYKQEYPNRYLAKFTHFLSENIQQPYIDKMLLDGFDDFIHSNIAKYEKYKEFRVGFTGSIAHHFSGILRKSGSNNNIEIAEIIEKPIDGLIKYHSLNK
jgi:N-acetylglucosamine kinase-like BadF-type ATPase